MILTLHGQVTLYSNILSDVRIARDAGYEALELHTDKLWRYLDSGGSATHLKRVLDQFYVRAAAIDIIGNLESTSSSSRRTLLTETERLCRVAVTIGAPTIQVNAFSGLDGFGVDDNIAMTARNLKEIAAIGKEHEVRFQIEAAAWTPIHTVDDCLRLVDATSADNVGLVIDFWHFWASRGATPEQIAKLDRDIIFGVHVCDGYRPEVGAPWPDETELRGVLPGEGDLPVQEWMDAVRSTGFDGFMSGEFLNPRMWERDHLEVAIAMREAMQRYIGT